MKKFVLLLTFFSVFIVTSSYALEPIVHMGEGNWVVPDGYSVCNYRLTGNSAMDGVVSIILNEVILVRESDFSEVTGSIQVSAGDNIEVWYDYGNYDSLSAIIQLSDTSSDIVEDPQPPLPPEQPITLTYMGQGSWVVPDGYLVCNYKLQNNSNYVGTSIILYLNNIIVDIATSQNEIGGNIIISAEDILTISFVSPHDANDLHSTLTLSNEEIPSTNATPQILPPIVYSGEGEWIVPAGYRLCSYKLIGTNEMGESIEITINGESKVFEFAFDEIGGILAVFEGDVIRVGYQNGGSGKELQSTIVLTIEIPPADLLPSLSYSGEGVWVVPAGYQFCTYKLIGTAEMGESIEITINGESKVFEFAFDEKGGMLAVFEGDVIRVEYQNGGSGKELQSTIILTATPPPGSMSPIVMRGEGSVTIPKWYTMYGYKLTGTSKTGDRITVYRNDRQVVSPVAFDKVEAYNIPVNEGDVIRVEYQYSENSSGLGSIIQITSTRMQPILDFIPIPPPPTPDPCTWIVVSGGAGYSYTIYFAYNKITYKGVVTSRKAVPNETNTDIERVCSDKPVTADRLSADISMTYQTSDSGAHTDRKSKTAYNTSDLEVSKLVEFYNTMPRFCWVKNHFEADIGGIQLRGNAHKDIDGCSYRPDPD